MNVRANTSAVEGERSGNVRLPRTRPVPVPDLDLSRPTVDPQFPHSPHCQTPTSLLTRLQHLETAQIEDALSLNAIARRMAKRGPEIRRLAAGLFGGS